MKVIDIQKQGQSAPKNCQPPNIRQTRCRSTGICIALLVVSVMVAGCAGSYGKLVSNPVIMDQYQTGSLSDEYQYYYSGRSGLPYAVVGIDKTYQFNSRLWFTIDSMDQVYKKISNLSDLHIDATRMRAADILDHNGKLIGVWFSYYYYTPVRINPETGVVEIFNPYDPNEDDRSWFIR
ncbi:MAG: hypothetical protein ABR534_11285 [Desulfotignum sp.]